MRLKSALHNKIDVKYQDLLLLLILTHPNILSHTLKHTHFTPSLSFLVTLTPTPFPSVPLSSMLGLGWADSCTAGG